MSEDDYVLTAPKDFDEYVALCKGRNATDRQLDEYTLRVLMHFTSMVYENKQPYPWVMELLANAFSKIAQGGEWEEALPLPWTKHENHFSKAEEDSLKIYCAIAVALNANDKLKVTKTISEEAKKHFVSNEKARAAYYKWKAYFGKTKIKIVEI